MTLKKMKIRIAADGRTQIEVEGGEGADCLAFTAAMEQTLGSVERREMTSDFEKETESVQVSEIERPTL